MAGTVLGTAAIMYNITHNPLSFLIVLMLFVHELGHYFSARKHKALPDLPYLIPTYPFIIGITRVKDMKPEDIPAMSIAGPITAIIFIILFMPFNYLYSFFSFVPLFALLGFEIIFNYFGPDGKKYRKYKNIVHT